MACVNCPDCTTVNDSNIKIRGSQASYVKLHPCDIETITGTLSPTDPPTTFGEQYGNEVAVLPVASPIKSITLTVIAGNVTVTTDAGGGFIAPANSTFTWGNDDYNGLDITGLGFSGDGSANFILHGEA